jgi:hypothetical protein
MKFFREWVNSLDKRRFWAWDRLDLAQSCLPAIGCRVGALVSANAQNRECVITMLYEKPGGYPMMFVTARCNYAGPLGKPIATRTFAAFLLARLHGRAIARFRW